MEKHKTDLQLRHDIRDLVQEFCDNKYSQSTFVPGETPIPVSGKVIGFDEISLIIESALDGWLTTGRFNSEFEKKLAKFLGIRYLLSVNSGSSANLVAFSTLTSPLLAERAIHRGDEIITVAAGFPTTINPILQYGAIPVFVDVDYLTHNIDVSKIESAISSKTRAIMLAHTLGNPFNVKEVKAICEKHRLWLVEDCCDALGSLYDGKLVGTFGDIGTLSFYPAHHITMGEGGAVFTNNSKLKLIAESFRDWGRDCYCEPGQDNTCKKRFSWKLGELPEGYDHKYIYSHVGYNLKITDMQAACALAQLGKLDNFIEKRRQNFGYLFKKLANYTDYFDLPVATPLSNPSWFGFPITLRESNASRRTDLLRFLESNKIGSRLLFAGNVTKQPYMKHQIFKVSGTLTNTDKIMNQTFWVGVFPGINEEMLDFVSEKIIEFVSGKI